MKGQSADLIDLAVAVVVQAITDFLSARECLSGGVIAVGDGVAVAVSVGGGIRHITVAGQEQCEQHCQEGSAVCA